MARREGVWSWLAVTLHRTIAPIPTKASLLQAPPTTPRTLYAPTPALDTSSFLPRRLPAVPYTSTLTTPWGNHSLQLYAIIIAISCLWSLASCLSFISCKTLHLPHQFAVANLLLFRTSTYRSAPSYADTIMIAHLAIFCAVSIDTLQPVEGICFDYSQPLALSTSRSLDHSLYVEAHRPLLGLTLLHSASSYLTIPNQPPQTPLLHQPELFRLNAFTNHSYAYHKLHKLHKPLHPRNNWTHTQHPDYPPRFPYSKTCLLQHFYPTKLLQALLTRQNHDPRTYVPQQCTCINSYTSQTPANTALPSPTQTIQRTRYTNFITLLFFNNLPQNATALQYSTLAPTYSKQSSLPTAILH
jgi:hypothetical protein